MVIPQGIVAALLGQVEGFPPGVVRRAAGRRRRALAGRAGAMVAVGLLLVDRGMRLGAPLHARASRGSFRTQPSEEGAAMCLPGTVEAVRDATERGEVPRQPPRRAGRRRRRRARRAAAARGAARRRQAARQAGRGKVADLTHVFRAGFPVYTGDAPARRDARRRSPATASTRRSGRSASTPARTWTRPATSSPAAGSCPSCARGAVRADRRDRHLRRAPRDDPDTAVGADDIRRYERRYGRIPRGAAVLMRSGWDAQGGRRARRSRTPTRAATYHFPGFGADAVELLIEARRRARSASTRSASTPATRRRSPSTSAGSAPTATGSRTSPTSARSRRAARR